MEIKRNKRSEYRSALILLEIKRKTSKPAGKAARNKKAMIIAFLFRYYKTAQMRHTKCAVFAQFYIQGE